MSDWLLVEVDNATGDTYRDIRRVGNVLQVTSIGAISRTTLDQWLLPVEKTYEYQKHAVPRTRRAKHQPRLM